MLKINRSERKKSTTAIIEGSRADALRAVLKRLGVNEVEYDSESGIITVCPVQTAECMNVDKLFMNDTYLGTTFCHKDDVYDEKVGEDVAVKKAMDNHKAAFKRAIVRWQVAMIKDIMKASSNTFEEALEKARK